jgi:hypothetical protein
MSNFKHTFKTGESKEIDFTLEDEKGLVSLTGKDVYLTISNSSLTENILELGVCVARDQTTHKGEVYYPLTSKVSNLFTPGSYKGEICVVDELGKTIFYPKSDITLKNYITFAVSRSLASP